MPVWPEHDTGGDTSVSGRLSVDGTGLPAALKDYVTRTAPEHVQVELAVAGPLGQVPGAVAEQLFLILRKAVRNALRHSGARRLSIELTVTDGVLGARVRDDGGGFGPPVAPHHGGGLQSMSERAELVGARLRVDSGDDGTRVEALVPPCAGERP